MDSVKDMIKAIIFVFVAIAIVIGAAVVGTFIVPVIVVAFFVYGAYLIIQDERNTK